jgi:ACS family hexuronate transporter-like MFS transporter
MLLIFVATALNYVDRQVISLLKPTLQAEFHWSNTDYANLGVAFQFATVLALIFVGWFVDRVGVRIAYAAAVALWSFAGMAHVLATTVTEFIVARIALAVGESVNTPAAVKAAATYMPLQARSISIGIINTAPNIGAILTPLLIPPFAVAFGWHAAFLVTGGLGFVWLAFWVAGTRRLVPIVTAPQAKQGAAKAGWATLLRDRRTWAIAGAKALTDQIWWFLLFWVPDLFSNVFHLSQAQLGLPVALIYSMAALGAVSSGLAFPALLKAGRDMNSARKTSMLAFACLIVPIPLALFVTSPWVAALLIGLALFAHQGFSTNIFGLAADVVPADRVARVMAIGAVFGNLTGMGIIKLTGWALDTGIGYWPMFAMAASAYLLACGWVHVLLPVIRSAHEGAAPETAP